jgi:P27 family predicted phage terminase small subunit
MTRGRTDPTPLKVLKGRSPGKDARGYDIATPPGFERGAPEPPDSLRPAGRDLWQRVAPGLERLDLLKPEDYAALVSYCEAWDEYRDAIAIVRAEGLISVHPKTGHAHVHPAQKVVETARMQVLKLGQQFGLTPVAEVALAKPAREVPGDDPFAGQAQTGS